MSEGGWPTSVPTPLCPFYATAELICSVLAALGNSVILYLIFRRRALRQNIKNAYVASLAIADLLVALVGIPFALSTYMGLPRKFEACLFTNSTLLVLFYASITNLLAVTVDRFWAITRPISYTVTMTPFKAGMVITLAWGVAIILGMLPLLGWNKGRPPVPRCFFVEVIGGDYLVFICFSAIVSPSIIIAIFNILIFRSVRKQGRAMLQLMFERSIVKVGTQNRAVAFPAPITDAVDAVGSTDATKVKPSDVLKSATHNPNRADHINSERGESCQLPNGTPLRKPISDRSYVPATGSTTTEAPSAATARNRRPATTPEKTKETAITLSAASTLTTNKVLSKSVPFCNEQSELMTVDRPNSSSKILMAGSMQSQAIEADIIQSKIVTEDNVQREYIEADKVQLKTISTGDTRFEITTEDTIQSGAATSTDELNDRKILPEKSSGPQYNDSRENRKLKQKQKQLRIETRAVQSIALLVLTFIVSWFPLYALNTYDYFCSLVNQNYDTKMCAQPHSLAFTICIVLSHYNSVWNPFLYAWGMRDIRRELKALVWPRKNSEWPNLKG